MRSALVLVSILAASVPAGRGTQRSSPEASVIRILLLGTQGGPRFSADRIGIGTLVQAGPEQLLFDAGRGVTTGMARASIDPASVAKVFLTHLHSDHVISLPELLISPWVQGRLVPLRVWGPKGTRSMMQHFEQALAFDIHSRRDVYEKFPAEGVRVESTDIREGVVYEANGVKVTAFLVDHGPVEPSYGFRVDYRGHSVVLSGDTRPSESLIKAAAGTDLLIHEVARDKQDPSLIGPPDEIVPGSKQTRRRAKAIADIHTDGREAGQVFARVKPKLALFSHYDLDRQLTLALVRPSYAGPVEFGEDAMIVDVGEVVAVRRPSSPR